MFSCQLVALNISENILSGDRFPVIEARDMDIGSNSVKTYKLNSKCSPDMESDLAKLVFQKSLDRERETVIRLVLIAVDSYQIQNNADS